MTVGTNEGCLSGCYWGLGGICSLCGARLRCGACGRFVTVAGLHDHIESACPVKWVEYEEPSAAAHPPPPPPPRRLPPSWRR